MYLLNFLRQQKNTFLVAILAFLISFLTISPVLKGGVDKVFYTIDPDVVYTANALLYIKSGYVSYFDHPGTPAVVLISFFLAPLRAYAKIVQHTPFITWVFNNYSQTFFYLRIMQSFLLFLSLLIISFALWSLTKKILPIITLFLILLSYGSFYHLGAVISADTLAFFITSIWLLFLSIYIKSKDTKLLFLLPLIAGVDLAVRATTFFLLPASFLVIFMSEHRFAQKIWMTLVSAMVAMLGFAAGVLPTRTKIVTVLKLIFSFASTTGVHMSGEKKYFNYEAFINSANTLLHTETFAVIIVVAAIILAIICFFSKERSLKTMALIILTFSLGAILFAKYPAARYERFNYLVIAFCSVVLLSKKSKVLLSLTTMVLILFAIPISKNYLIETSESLNRSGYLEKFAKNNPPEYASVWEYSSSKEFSYLWNRDYGDGIFDDELYKLPHKIYELRPSMNIGISVYSTVDIFSVCWDELYVQNTSLRSLLDKYPVLNKSVQQIPNTSQFLIRSDHCSTKKFILNN